MSPVISEILLSGFMINSTLRRRTHLTPAAPTTPALIPVILGNHAATVPPDPDLDLGLTFVPNPNFIAMFVVS